MQETRVNEGGGSMHETRVNEGGGSMQETRVNEGDGSMHETRVNEGGGSMHETRVNEGGGSMQDRADRETRASGGEGSVSGAMKGLLARVMAASSPSAEGTQELRAIGRYVALGRLGAGGMGVVYKAYDPDLDRKVAIKVLRGRSTAEAQARLLREAQAMAKLSHPNVVSVFDVGIVGDQVFVAMDYVEGQDLAAWLAAAPRPWQEVLDVFVQAAAGLAAAHAVGLIHRDFKGENVLLSRETGSGRLRAQVADFGLARLDEEETRGGAQEAEEVMSRGGSALLDRLTGVGAVMGTPGYMSPEQHAGASVDARTDLYSFSVALYEALYRQRPYEGRTYEEMAAAASGPRRPAPAGSKAPRWLYAAAIRGMHPERDQRFTSMEALLAAIAAGRGRRVRAAVGVGGAVAASALALGIGLRGPTAQICTGGAARAATAWNEGRAAAAERAFAATGAPFAGSSWALTAGRLEAYAGAWTAAYTETCAATRIRGESSEAAMDLKMGCLGRRLEALDSLVDLLEVADNAVVVRAVDAAAALPDLAACEDLEGLREGPPAPAAAQSAAVEALQGRLSAAKARMNAGKDQEALALLGPLAAEAEALGYEPLIVEVWLARGAAEVEGGAHEQAAQTFQAALWRAVAAGDDGAALDASRRLIHVVGFKLMRAEEAGLWSEHAKALVRRRGDRRRDRGDVARALATVALAAGRNEEAEALAAEGVELARAGGAAEELRLVDRLTALGAARVRGGRYAAAEAPLVEAVALASRLRGAAHPDLASPLSTLALVLERQARYDEAIAALQRCVQILSGASGPEHPNVGLLRQNLGGMYVMAGAYEAAAPELAAALRILEASLGPEHPALGGTLAFMGDRALAVGALAEAEAAYSRSVTIRSAALGAEHPDLSLSLLGLGRVALARGEQAAAVTRLEAALKNMSGEGVVVDPGDRGQVEVTLAQALWATEPGRARALISAGLASLAAAGAPVARQLEEAERWLGAQARAR
ncbi:MAG: serine/threonine protein kinase [Nannocystis sp.]|nr:serine/threonine protein kinase [Nannocystis sp.]